MIPIDKYFQEESRMLDNNALKKEARAAIAIDPAPPIAVFLVFSATNMIFDDGSNCIRSFSLGIAIQNCSS